MALIEGRAKLDLVLQFTVNEAEARALDALSGYGADGFIKAFYDVLGQVYMRDHEQGLRTFLISVRQFVPRELAMLDRARAELKPPVACGGGIPGCKGGPNCTSDHK